MDDDFSEWINDKEYGFDISTTKLIKLDDEVTVGVELCEDLWVTNPPSNKLATEGANIIINLSASDEYVSKAQYRKKLIETQSAKCICGRNHIGPCFRRCNNHCGKRNNSCRGQAFQP